MTGRTTGPVRLTPGDWRLAGAACGDEQRATERWREWCSEHDVESVPDHSYPFLVALGARADTGLTGDEAGRLRGLHRRNWYVTQRLGALAVASVAALVEHGVQSVVFGPLVSAVTAGDRAGWRHVTGVDLLVDPDDAITAAAVLIRRGLAVTRRPARRRTSVAVLTDGDGQTLRLHRVLPHVGTRGPIDDGPWQRRVSTALAGGEVHTLAVADALVLATAPRLGWVGPEDAAWPLDVHHLVTAHTAGRWDDMVAAATATPWAREIGRALARCGEQLDTPVPAQVLEQLARAPGPHLAVRAERTVRQLRGRLRSAARPAPLRPGDA